MRYRYLLLLLLGSLPLLSVAAPVEFIRNDGQWAAPFRYKAEAGNGTVFLAPDAFTYLLSHPANRDRIDAAHHGWTKEVVKLEFHAYRMTFLGANKEAPIAGSKEQSWYYNYFLGNDSSRWRSGIHPALALDYNAVYPGINLHVASESGLLKYEWIVAEGRQPSAIRMKIEGADGLSLKGGNLIIKTSVGDVQELKPVAFQYGTDGRHDVACRYRLTANELSYDFPDGWDERLPLVIDPTVVFCTMTGSTADNWGYTATYDGAGNFYAGGIMLSYPGSGGGSFPATTGAFQASFGGGVNDPNFATGDDHGVGFASDIAIMKLNATGTTRIWATYIGGSDNEQPHSMMVDASNNLVIAGASYSSNYPVTSGCYDATTNGGADIVVTKLNAAGTALIGSTYIGGSAADGINYSASEYVFGNLKYNYGDGSRSEVILDNAANVYVTASTRSTNFPVSTNAYQNSLAGGQDAVLIKLNPTLTALTYSTYLGGTLDDAGYVLALDTAQTHLYVGGGTQSSNFPGTGGAWKNSYQGGSADGFIARFGNGGTYPLQKTTFMGASGYDQVYGVQIDLENNVYAMGQTLGGGFPVTAGVYSNPVSSQFIIKMDSLLTTNVFSTVFGSGSSSQTNISPVAFLVDTCQNIYISGWGGNLGFTGSAPASIGTTTGMPVTPATIVAPMKSTTDGYDFYFIALAKNASSLLFGAYLGRNDPNPNYGEHVDGGTSRFDRSGIVYQGICANCGGAASPAFPTTSGSWATAVGSANCNEAALKIAFQLSVPDAIAAASPKTRGCPPLPVQFQNTSVNAISYSWDFADGSALDTSFSPKHTFTAAGIYKVRLVVYNPNACRTRDTTYITITVDNNRVQSAFNTVVLDSCGPYRASFSNTSQYSALPGAAARTTFLWIFGDGTTYSGTTPPIHSYASAGTYTVMLVMRDTAACNNPDTARKVISMNGLLVKAAFNLPDSVCLTTGLAFSDASQNASAVVWNFGDGQTSNIAQTTHTYAQPGSYRVVLTAVNPASCNKRDSVVHNIRIKRLPIAAFFHDPVVPVSNVPINFSNKSQYADAYDWAFGDGAHSIEENPSHLYRRTGTYRVCLVASTPEGCSDSVCKIVEADVHPAVGVPTAFSPNGDHNNDMFFVKGAAIETMNIKIYNRWGEKVFESTSMDAGWDGTYKGKPQEMDAYAYVLIATFIDGTSTTQKGHITLIR